MSKPGTYLFYFNQKLLLFFFKNIFISVTRSSLQCATTRKNQILAAKYFCDIILYLRFSKACLRGVHTTCNFNSIPSTPFEPKRCCFLSVVLQSALRLFFTMPRKVTQFYVLSLMFRSLRYFTCEKWHCVLWEHTPGHTQKFEKGAGTIFCVHVSTENIGEDLPPEKGLHVFRRAISSPKSSEDQKKRSTRPQMSCFPLFR